MSNDVSNMYWQLEFKDSQCHVQELPVDILYRRADWRQFISTRARVRSHWESTPLCWLSYHLTQSLAAHPIVTSSYNCRPESGSKTTSCFALISAYATNSKVQVILTNT